MKNSFLVLILILFASALSAQTAMTNIAGRKQVSLNGKWDAIVDLFSHGQQNKIYQNKKPESNTQFIEYSFGDGLRLDVPGDWNSQSPELKYYESSIWYKRDFNCPKTSGKRYFIHFGAVNYLAKVYLNGQKIGEHEGGFSPFQFEITDKVKVGPNFVILEVNSARKKDGIPSLLYDWWNYGGITRDVALVETPVVYIHDYTLQLSKKNDSKILAKIRLSGESKAQKVTVSIPELKVKQEITTDTTGIGTIEFTAKPTRWSPENPKLYNVRISTNLEQIEEKIGFRTIEAKGNAILLNGKKVFLAGINVHDEIAQRQGRAYSSADAASLLNEAKKLGCNYIRLTHYPASEIMVRMAEEMGIMLWEEIPTWQDIQFDNPKTKVLGEQMIREMIARDKNRCAIIFWSVANETKPSPARNQVLTEYIQLCRSLDDTRLVTAAFNNANYDATTNTVKFSDPLMNLVDVVSINKYFGWYDQWPIASKLMKWEVCVDKPFLYSEFGGEALYGQSGSADVASSWSEEYQEKLYKDHIEMFDNIPNFCGLSPWVMVDFRSPYRMHQRNQQEWNRKGIISDKGMYKKAWFVLHDYYMKKLGK
jgi:beta-glucuronidase